MKKDAPGLQVTKIENKIGLRIVQNGDILLSKVFVPDEDRLPGVNSFQDTSKVRFAVSSLLSYPYDLLLFILLLIKLRVILILDAVSF